MTHKRQLPEQMASHRYKRAAQQNEGKDEERAPKAPQSALKPAVLRREVNASVADPSTAWSAFARRRERLRRTRSKATLEHEQKVAPRTFAQTGFWATGGRKKNIRRRDADQPPAEVPVRSGTLGARRGLLWKLAGLVVGVIVLIIALSFAFTGSAFRIEQVQVAGTTNSALIQEIQKQGMQGQNIFLINVPALESRVRTLPLVRTADVSKQWPNQLTITVQERIPVLLWQTNQGTYSVDKDGVLIAKANETPGAESLPTVIAPTTVSAQADTKTGKAGSGQGIKAGMQVNAADIQFAKDVFERLPKVAGVNVFQLRYDGTMYANTIDGQGTRRQDSGSYVVVSQSGWKAYLGNASDTNSLNNRLLTLKAILDMAQEQQLSLASIDLRYGLRPVYTLK